MKVIAIFALVFIIGLIGSVYAYAQPSSDSLGVVFVLMFIIGAIGLFIMFILFLIKGGKG